MRGKAEGIPLYKKGTKTHRADQFLEKKKGREKKGDKSNPVRHEICAFR
jgi:hypothetical protein